MFGDRAASSRALPGVAPGIPRALPSRARIFIKRRPILQMEILEFINRLDLEITGRQAPFEMASGHENRTNK
jgi:hypothetical protein